MGPPDGVESAEQRAAKPNVRVIVRANVRANDWVNGRRKTFGGKGPPLSDEGGTAEGRKMTVRGTLEVIVRSVRSGLKKPTERTITFGATGESLSGHVRGLSGMR